MYCNYPVVAQEAASGDVSATSTGKSQQAKGMDRVLIMKDQSRALIGKAPMGAIW